MTSASRQVRHTARLSQLLEAEVPVLTVVAFLRPLLGLLGGSGRGHNDGVARIPVGRRGYLVLVGGLEGVDDPEDLLHVPAGGQRVGVVTSLRLMHVDVDEPDPIVVEVAWILRNGRGENVNKSQRAYRFAVGEDASRYLGLMIQDRVERGEPLEPGSWLFRSYSRHRGDKEVRKVKLSEAGLPLSVAQVGKIVRKAAEDRGIQRKFGKRNLIHPHGFRRYWKHQLRMGGVDSDLLDYMMGHVLPYGGAYDRWTLEDLRGQYRRAENYVCLRPVYAVSREDVRTEVFKVLLGSIGREDVEKISENLGLTPDQIVSLLNRFGEEGR